MPNAHLHKAKRQKNDYKYRWYLKNRTPDEYYLTERRDNYNPDEWKPLPRCNDYEVSINGEIYYKGNVEINPRRKSGMCTQHINRNGYRTAALNYDGTKTREYVHRLVAETWIPNPDNKPEIDHIIPVREGGDNSVMNLRWVTHKENYENHRTKETQIQSHLGLTSNIKGRHKVWIDKENKIYKMVI